MINNFVPTTVLQFYINTALYEKYKFLSIFKHQSFSTAQMDIIYQHYFSFNK